MAQHHESAFETELCEYLAAHGWLYSPTDAGYDRDLALFPEDVFGWLADTQPEQLAKRVKPDLTGQAVTKARQGVLTTLVKALDADPKANGGTLSVLRRGFKDLNAQFSMCQFRPNTSLNATTAKRYESVRLRVMRQVHYSTKHNNSIDLVFFVNGIPVATAELKTDFTQNITDAVLQYKHDRLPKGEPLLAFGSRALVHFAVSNSEVQMTTKLAGKDTVFLPFNRGNNAHAGNPPNPIGSPTAYLWETILQRDTWLDILGRFMHLQITEKIDRVSGKKSRKQTMLFPRFHQWEAVTKLIDAARTEGPGHRYLIQHSAGSGKTNSISWLAHRLSVLHDEESSAVFDSVIVITDRNVLDAQLQEAIRQIDRTPGVVAHIDGLGSSKSQLLADALEGGTKIIIVTIQTFPYALELIRNQAKLKGKNFAVIADEAHSSQAGEASKRLKSALTATEIDELADGGTVDAEDVLAAEMTARAQAKNLSFFAFTATPKNKTLELFGRKGPDGTPQPFHLYSMQQAVEEGFILDVLKNYTPYKTAFRLTHNGRSYESETTAAAGTVAVTGSTDGELVDKQAAIKSVMNWVKLHPTNISQKVGIIVEHFRGNVAWRLDGRAKAMVVTSSRKAAVRYKLAFDTYLANHGYTDVAALVAFSGDVTDLDLGVEKATETSMNPGLKGRDLREAFATDEYQVMLVANKFQTGFDQPLLVAMYVDKKLSGVAAVQTLSRLNRTAPGKDQTFVLDFANTAEEIVEAFEPYYQATTLADVTDPNIVHTTMAKLDAAGVYLDSEIDGLVADYLADKGNNALTKWITPARDRFRDRERTATEAGDTVALDELEMFRKDVGTFLRQYDFLSQIVDYEDPSLEKLSIYLRHLAPQITREQLNHEIDLSTVNFDYIAQHEQATTDGKLTGDVALAPAKEAGTGTVRDPEMVALEEVIEKINDLFDGDHPDSSVRNVVTHIRDRLEESETLQQQAQNNSMQQFSASPDLHSEFLAAVIGAMDSSADLSAQILNNQGLSQKLLEALLPAVYRRLKDIA
ncbi:type I restriction-modification system, restriction subunit R [Rhodococcus aetherivorans]|uniref:Type I restriction-modification system, restriction subunit R n=1 Tax=Rhodococcus aetherivorans TaxID=191292 RepID=A0ABQ0YN01_9NOCA|nr:DEAD/DEAH box helicase family protein [Rhodococcus aetherivorans]ETT28763.1 type III restriction protein res subunit [Rhodococcus rhodochrous ATCC 21198]NGP26400.1 type I restriction endonuclease subunit R [Rhodococcus aetherivorans]GES37945.1 type I restriction-modification system, restriction subunit R [Rhodococcus aetherivorans]